MGTSMSGTSLFKQQIFQIYYIHAQLNYNNIYKFNVQWISTLHIKNSFKAEQIIIGKKLHEQSNDLSREAVQLICKIVTGE